MNPVCPNRLLDLHELDTPFFRHTIDAMNELTREYPGLTLHPSKQWECPWAMENAELEPGSAVLDAGCGSSVFPLYLSRLGHRVHACDVRIDPEAVRDMPATYVRADLTCLPFEDEQFDAVFCISVIEHIGRRQMTRALWELHRVLKPGRRLLLTTDFYEDCPESLVYRDASPTFKVDWDFFDRQVFERLVLDHPGFTVASRPNFDVDWPTVKRQMIQFHGYPCTSIGVALIKTPR